MTESPDTSTPAGHNGVATDQLRAFVDRIERVREEKQEYADDEKAIFAEAKANGFDVAALRRQLKRRKMKPHDLEEMEAMDDLYRHALGMAKDLPLFRSVGAMAVDRAARDSVVAALSQLVPDRGEIVLTVGGQSIRMWRDDTGETHSEEVRETPIEPETGTPAAREARSGRRRPEPPDVDDDGARELGRQAARDNEAVISNPFPWDDDRRRIWDAGWREVSGSDGMGGDE